MSEQDVRADACAGVARLWPCEPALALACALALALVAVPVGGCSSASTPATDAQEPAASAVAVEEAEMPAEVAGTEGETGATDAYENAAYKVSFTLPEGAEVLGDEFEDEAMSGTIEYFREFSYQGVYNAVWIAEFQDLTHASAEAWAESDTEDLRAQLEGTGNRLLDVETGTVETAPGREVAYATCVSEEEGERYYYVERFMLGDGGAGLFVEVLSGDREVQDAIVDGLSFAS